MKHDDSIEANQKAETAQALHPDAGRDVPVVGEITTAACASEAPDAMLRAQRLLDRLLWQAFTKRGRHEKNVR
ncbi:MAG: hypothetical protein IT364_27960 [Candidatus Hydrogenedentes bacterium]|nr:hypothetical protein [Candidatus Hydrogenedentota bacterium]